MPNSTIPDSEKNRSALTSIPQIINNTNYIATTTKEIATTIPETKKNEEAQVVLLGFSQFKLATAFFTFYLYLTAIKNFLYTKFILFPMIIIQNGNIRRLLIETKANCTFNISLNQTADLSCDLNVENHKDIKTFSFKTSQINTDNNEIYLSKFNDIVLINSEKNDDKKGIISVAIICGVVGAALIGVVIFFLVRKLKSKKEETFNEVNNANHIEKNENRIKTDNIMVYEVNSAERISRLETK